MENNRVEEWLRQISMGEFNPEELVDFQMYLAENPPSEELLERIKEAMEAGGVEFPNLEEVLNGDQDIDTP